MIYRWGPLQAAAIGVFSRFLEDCIYNDGANSTPTENVQMVGTDRQQLRSQSKDIYPSLSPCHKQNELETDQVLPLQGREEIPDRERIPSRDAMNDASKRCNVVLALAKSAGN